MQYVLVKVVIEVVQEGVSSRAIHNCEYLAYFESKKKIKKMKIKNEMKNRKEIMQLFSAKATMFFVHKKRRNTLKSFL